MTITIIGAGYVGLVTAAVFSDLGNKVFCVDVDINRVVNLKKGQVPFYEPQLEDYIKRNTEQKRLTFTTSYKESVPKSQIVLICVGTPSQRNGEANLSFLFSAVEEVAKNMTNYTVIAIKSTIPIGFEDDIEATAKKYAKGKFEFASSPEFLREGTAIEDSLHPDRIVIGSQSKKAQKILLELHAPIGGERLICDTRSAQLIKYASNALLATKVSYANAIANICEATGADVEKVLAGVGADKRIGRAFLYPGIGYGGSCLPKDVLAFISIGNYFNYSFELLKAVNSINENQIDYFVKKIVKVINGRDSKNDTLTDINIAILGLSFKPNTDDIRDAPAIKLIKSLKNLGAKITAFDPKAMASTQKIISDIDYAKNEYDAVKNKDAVVFATEWNQFLQMDFLKVKTLMKRGLIFDGRNMLSKEKLTEIGFEYVGVGR